MRRTTRKKPQPQFAPGTLYAEGFWHQDEREANWSVHDANEMTLLSSGSVRCRASWQFEAAAFIPLAEAIMLAAASGGKYHTVLSRSRDALVRATLRSCRVAPRRGEDEDTDLAAFLAHVSERLKSVPTDDLPETAMGGEWNTAAKCGLPVEEVRRRKAEIKKLRERREQSYRQ